MNEKKYVILHVLIFFAAFSVVWIRLLPHLVQQCHYSCHPKQLYDDDSPPLPAAAAAAAAIDHGVHPQYMMQQQQS